MNKFGIILKKEIRDLITVQNIIPLVLMFVLFMFLGNVMGGLMDGGDTIIIAGESGELAIDTSQVIGFIDNDNSEFSGIIRDTLAAQGILALPSSSDPAQAMQELEAYSFHGEQISVTALVVINPGFESSLRASEWTAVDVYTAIDSFGMTAMMGGAAHSAIAIINDIISHHLMAEADIEQNVHFLTNPVWANDFTYLNQAVENVPAQAVLGYVTSQTSFVPIIIMIIIMTGASTLATSMANEKADKTLETLMTTPVSRIAVLTAKLLSAAVLAAIYAVVYVFAFQNFSDGLAGGSGFPDGFADMMANFGIVFNAATFALIGAQLFLAVLCGLAIAIIIGMMVDDIKSLQSYILPLTVVIMIPYFVTLFVDINTLPMIAQVGLYIIPFTHAFTAAFNLFVQNYTMIIIGFAYQAVFLVVMMTIAVKIFNSDKLFTLGQIFVRKPGVKKGLFARK